MGGGVRLHAMRALLCKSYVELGGWGGGVLGGMAGPGGPGPRGRGGRSGDKRLAR